jgi:hypothetical protein
MSYNVPESAQVKVKEVEAWMDSVGVATITDQPAYEGALSITKQIKLKITEIDLERQKITAPLNDALTAANDFFQPMIKKLQSFEAGLKRTMIAYLQERERVRLDLERKAREDAEKLKASLEKKADKQEEQGKPESAELTRSMAETVTAAAPPPVNKGTGAYTVETWSANVKDKDAFVKWCIEANRLEYLEVNMSMLNSEAKQTKGQRTWPGVETEKKVDMRIRK